jgi:hypothetical protein
VQRTVRTGGSLVDRALVLFKACEDDESNVSASAALDCLLDRMSPQAWNDMAGVGRSKRARLKGLLLYAVRRAEEAAEGHVKAVLKTPEWPEPS